MTVWAKSMAECGYIGYNQYHVGYSRSQVDDNHSIFQYPNEDIIFTLKIDYVSRSAIVIGGYNLGQPSGRRQLVLRNTKEFQSI